jgi:hypothetical protein
MAVRKASDSNIAGKKYNDASAGASKVVDVVDPTYTIGTATDVGTGRAFNNGAATVEVNRGTTGGVPVSYTVVSNPGNFTATGATPVTVTGLQSGTAYTFTATAASNGTVTTTYSTSASSSITATSVPAAPTVGTPTAPTPGVGTVTVPVTAPANNGGKTISSYTATSSPGNITGTLSQAGSGNISVTGLTVGTTYTFTVTATNANGTSSASSASSSVRPAFPTSLTDNFNRTTSGNLGSTSTGSYTWTADAGTWYTNGSRAQSDNTSGTPWALASLNADGGGNATMNLNTPSGGGVGLAYWVSGAGSWYATFPYFESSTTQTCDSGSSCPGHSCTPANCCGSIIRAASHIWDCLGPGGGGWGGCSTTYCYQWCNGCNGEPQQQFIQCNEYSYCTAFITTTTRIGYLRTQFRVSSGSIQTLGNQQVASDTGGFPTIASIQVITNGNGVTARAYSGANQSSQLGSTWSFTPSSPARFARFGIYKHNSENQGSVVDDFSVSSVS